jgi:pimeloyl-ACP methyl ester carboxylesterase
MAPTIERKTCAAADGVRIVCSASGSGEPGLVFIHGGLANRGFWDHQLETFAAHHRVIAPDLPGHGESGTDRQTWGMREFGADIRRVVEAEHLGTIIIVGNSLGGPVAIETALLLGEQVLGVVGVDTFQSLDYMMSSEDARHRAESFRDDFAGNLRQMVKALFQPDADPVLMADAEHRMAGTSVNAAYEMFASLGGYAPAASARRLTMPLRAINGDLYPTDVAAVRKVKPDFEVIVMPHMGHYPMLERPDEFDRHVAAVIAELTGPQRRQG